MDKTLNHIVDSYYQPANEVRFKEYKPPQHPLGPRATTPYNKPPIENSSRSSEQVFDLPDENENNDDFEDESIFEEELTDDTPCN